MPPGQQLVAPGRWPPIGEREPSPGSAIWQLELSGLVAAPRTWTIDELRRDERAVARTIDIHCVTRWSKLDVPFVGLPLVWLLDEAGVAPAARYLNFVARSGQGHSTSLPLADVVALDPLVAWEAEGAPLPRIHGGPLRLIVPGRYFYKSLKWLARIELTAEDQLGFWERTAGYHNHADPWREERYMAPALDKQRARQRLAARDFRGVDLRSLVAVGLDLAGLQAEKAMLRDADFSRANLRGARFDGANLSNARLDAADLRETSLVGADLEGASLIGADLRGADLRGASLIAATLANDDLRQGALLDRQTRFDVDCGEQLMPAQACWLRRALAAFAE